MRFSGVLFITIFCAAAQASELTIQRQPTVVYESQSTVSAWPYYKRLESTSTPSQGVHMPEDTGIKPMHEQLPLTTNKLRVGKPAIKIQEGLFLPLFIMGMDPVSLNWFEQAADELASLGADGVVVQASNVDNWLSLYEQARDLGIDLILLNGDSLAWGYRIETYPMVIVSPEQAAQAGYE